MKKIIALLCVSCMLIGTLPVFAANEITDSVRIAKIENVGSDSNNLQTNTIDNGTNEVTAEVTYDLLDNGSLLFSGEINDVAFSVNAEPYSTPANENVRVFNGVDQLNHYQVIYVATEKEIANSVKYFDDTDDTAYNGMIKLYMRTNNTEDLVIVEIFTNQPHFIAQINKVQPTLKSLDTSDNEEGKLNQFWYAKVFVPTETYEEGPSTYAYSSKDNQGTYTYTYNHLGATYNQYLVLNRYIRWPNSFSNDGEFQTALQVSAAYTEVPGYPNENSDTTHMRVDDVVIDVAIDAGDALNFFTLDGMTNKGANVNVKLKFNTGIPLYGRLSLATSYNKSVGNYDLNTEDQHVINSENNYHRQLRAEMEEGCQLVNDTHYFSVIWKVGNYSGAKSNQSFQARFSYRLINLMDYTHWTNGNKQLTDTVYYNTNR